MIPFVRFRPSSRVQKPEQPCINNNTTAQKKIIIPNNSTKKTIIVPNNKHQQQINTNNKILLNSGPKIPSSCIKTRIPDPRCPRNTTSSSSLPTTSTSTKTTAVIHNNGKDVVKNNKGVFHGSSTTSTSTSLSKFRLNNHKSTRNVMVDGIYLFICLLELGVI